MHGAQIKSIKNPGPYLAKGNILLLKNVGWIAGIILIAIAFGLASAFGEVQTFWQNYVIDVFYFLSFALFGILLTALHYGANMTWSANVRRVSEGFTNFLIPGGLFVAVLIAFGTEHVYDWAADHHIHEHFDSLKQSFLSKEGFAIVTVVFIGVMYFFRQKLVMGISVAQDDTGDVELSKKGIKYGIAFGFFFMYLFTLFVVQLVLAVDSNWFSTMFGVYCFIGLFLSGFALTSIVTVGMMDAGYLKEAVKKHHLKDLGTWQMGFSAFMMYIGFSQFMLIWYANMPAETAYFIARMNNGWENIFIFLPLLKWIIPFVFLMPWNNRDNPKSFRILGGGILFGQWLDLYWMVMPGGESGPHFTGYIEILVFAGFLLTFASVVLKFYTKHSMLAHRDPKLISSANGLHL